MNLYCLNMILLYKHTLCQKWVSCGHSRCCQTPAPISPRQHNLWKLWSNIWRAKGYPSWLLFKTFIDTIANRNGKILLISDYTHSQFLSINAAKLGKHLSSITAEKCIILCNEEKGFKYSSKENIPESPHSFFPKN